MLDAPTPPGMQSVAAGIAVGRRQSGARRHDRLCASLAMTAPLISVRDLRKRYGGVTALDGLNLDVAPRHDPRRRRRERRRQVDADEGAGRRRQARRRRNPARGHERRRWTRPPPRGGAASASSIRNFRCSRSAPCWPICSSIASRCAAGWCRPDAMREMSREMLDRLGLHVDVDAPVGRLSIGEQQLVELARVLLEEPQAADPRRAQLGAQQARDGASVRGAAAASQTAARR